MPKIADIATQIRGVSYTPEDVLNIGAPNSVGVLRANNIEDGTINFNNLVYIKKSRVASQQMLQKGDILVCASSGSKNLVGKAAMITENCDCSFGAFCKVIRPISVPCEYLDAFFQSKHYRDEIASLSMGANINNIRNEHIDNLCLPEVSDNEQQHIIETVSKLRSVITIRKQQLSALDTLIKARFVEMFGDMYCNEFGWLQVQLSDVADIVSGITKGRKTKDNELLEVPYMAVSNVKDGYIDWTTVKTIMATASEITQYRLLPYDVLMTEGGDPDKLGRGAIIHKPLENCIHQNHVFRVRLDTSKVLPEFFAEYLQHQKAKRYFLGCAKQTTGIASINMGQLKRLPLLSPPIKQQAQFAAFVSQVDKSKVAVQKALDEAQLLFDSLMQKYFQ